jgi:hypothetical protein
MGALCLVTWMNNCYICCFFHAYINEMHGSRSKIPNLPWKTCWNLNYKYKRILILKDHYSWSQGLHGLRCGSAAAGLLGFRVRIPQKAWMFASCECFVLSGLRFGLNTDSQESYRKWRVWVWSWYLENEETLTQYGVLRGGKKRIILNITIVIIKPLPVQWIQQLHFRVFFFF